MVHGSQTTLKERNTCFLFFRTFPKEPLNLSKYWYTYSVLKLKEKPGLMTSPPPVTPSKTNPENRPRGMEHGKKNIYQTIIPPILLNSGDFLGVLKNLHLFTFHQTKGSLMAGPCSSMDSRPQCLTVAMRRIAKTWCDHPGGHRDEWPGPQLYEQVTEIHGNSNPKESRRWTKVAFWQILPFQVRIPISLWSHLLRLVGLDRIWVSSPKNLLPKKRMQRMPWKMEKMMALEDDSFLFEMVPISGYRLW